MVTMNMHFGHSYACVTKPGRAGVERTQEVADAHSGQSGCRVFGMGEIVVPSWN